MNPFRVSIFISILFLLAGCDSRTPEQINNAHYNSGYSQGFADGRKEGSREGYKEGFTTAHPSGEVNFSENTAIGIRIIEGLGAAKVLFLIVLLCSNFIDRSRSVPEISAKLIMAVIGGVIAFFSANSTGIPTALANFLLMPAPGAIWIVTLIMSLFAYISATVIGTVLDAINGPKIEAWCMLIAAALGTVLAQSFFQVIFLAPLSSNYLAMPILIGILVGGAFYFAMRLLDQGRKPEKRA